MKPTQIHPADDVAAALTDITEKKEEFFRHC